MKCPDCGGSGIINTYTKEQKDFNCPTCQGKDLYREETDLEVPDGYEFSHMTECVAYFGLKTDDHFLWLYLLPNAEGDKSVCSVCDKGWIYTGDGCHDVCQCVPKTVVKIEVGGNKLITWWREI